MKKSIRKSVFETNSSSMHSLSVIGSDRYDMLFDEQTDIYRDEYGWGYDELTTPKEKLSYIFTEYQNNEEFTEEIIKAVEDFTDSKIKVFGEGYIDHESQGMIDYEINTVQDIIDIVFNSKYTIIIDNDNH